MSEKTPKARSSKPPEPDVKNTKHESRGFVEIKTAILQILFIAGFTSSVLTIDNDWNDGKISKTIELTLKNFDKEKKPEIVSKEVTKKDVEQSTTFQTEPHPQKSSNQENADDIDKLIERLDSIRYENHSALTQLDRAVFCIFFNEFLIGKDKNLQQLWMFIVKEMQKGELTVESQKKLDEIFAEVVNTKTDFSKKSIFTKEGLAAGFLPGNKNEIMSKISSFLAGKKNVQNLQTGFKRVFEVIERNPGLNDKIEGLFKNLIEAIKIEIKNDSINGTVHEKEEARKLLLILIDTLKVLEEKK